MGNRVLKNPLTYKEKAKLIRLINHDLVDYQNKVIQDLGTALSPELNIKVDYEKSWAAHKHSYHIMQTLTILGTHKRLYLKKTSEKDIKTFLTRIENNFSLGKQFQTSIDSFTDLYTEFPVIYTSLHTMVKNSIRLTNEDERDIRIEVSTFEGNIPDPAFIPEDIGATEYICFKVRDNGPGFPKRGNPKRFLKLGASTRGEYYGFGLYFVSLACKFLRSAITIDSQPGDTVISIYHPTNLDGDRLNIYYLQ